MKKILVLFTAAMLLFSTLSFTASAAVPTELNIYKTKTAPNINDSGKIEAVYGEKVFDIKASELSKDDQNLYPNTQREPHMLEDKGVKDAIKVMRNIGYMTYDDDNLYIACEVTDVAPKAASNSAEPWRSTNLQLVMFVNEELSFITVAYEGTNKVGVVNDRRSVMDYELVEATFFEKSKTNYVYEIKIPWESFPEVTCADDVWYFKMGVVQSSMANGYVCAAFGEAYFLQAPKCVTVNLKGLKTDASQNTSSKEETDKDDDKNNTSSSNKDDDKNSKPSNNTSSSNKNDNEDKNASDKTESQNKPSNDSSKTESSSVNNSSAVDNSDKNDKPTDNKDTASEDKKDDSANKQEDVDAPEQGTDIVTSESDNAGETIGESGEATTTVVQEEAEKDWTPIIIIAVVAVVIIAGGAVAIVLLNKKPKEDKK